MALFPPFPVDLHCHTTRSDGNDRPEELIENAAVQGLLALGITDHDIQPPAQLALSGGRSISPSEYAAELGLIFVPGYEFSTNTWVDDVHICGYGLDWEHPELQAEVDAAARSKSDAYYALCQRLGDLGMPVDWQNEILHFTRPDGSPGERTPDEVQRKHIFEAMAARGYAESWSAAKLMVRDNPDLNIPRRKIDSVEAIRLIHTCGGVAILAHPYLIDDTVRIPDRKPIPRSQYIHELIDAGLDGIEIRYTYDKTTYRGSLTPKAIEYEVRAVFSQRLKFISGGSDYHAGHKKGEQKIRQIGERGLTVQEFSPIFQHLKLPDPRRLYA